MVQSNAVGHRLIGFCPHTNDFGQGQLEQRAYLVGPSCTTSHLQTWFFFPVKGSLHLTTVTIERSQASSCTTSHAPLPHPRTHTHAHTHLCASGQRILHEPLGTVEHLRGSKVRTQSLSGKNRTWVFRCSAGMELAAQSDKESHLRTWATNY
jgi:hypothetical protein